jgi:hypothetical protein
MAGTTPAAPAEKKKTDSHFSASRERALLPTPKEWLKLGAQMGDLCNEWSRRGDIVATVGPKAGMGSPACFKPLIAEMEINTELAFGEATNPEYVDDFNLRQTQFDYPVAAGAILHEAMHARHTHWSLLEVAKHKNRAEAKLVELFEESRIEARGVQHFKKNRSFLRACALKLVIGDLKPSEVLAGGVMGLSQLMLLTMARVDAGVLEKDDVELVKEKSEEFFGKPLVKKLRKLWIKAQAHNKDYEWEPLRKIAEEWIKLLEDAGHDPEAEASEGLKIILVGIMGEMGEMAEEVESDARTEGTVQIVMELGEEAAAAAEEEAKESEEHEKMKAMVFDKTTGYSGSSRSGSRLAEERPPKPEERAAAITVARELEKARYRDRVEVSRSTVLPPGRLRGRAAVQGAAARAQGRPSTVEPWQSTRRYHTEDPNLTMAWMTDISGSMSAAMKPMGITDYVLSEAGRRVDAKMASVYYGQGVFPGLRPGEHRENVRIYTAPDSTERFDDAFKALNGAVNLLGGSGARLLVIVSDFCYTPDQIEAAKKWLARCKSQGVAVINLPYGNSGYSHAMAKHKDNDLRVLDAATDPASAALMIGHEAAKALTAIGRAD